MVDMNYQKQVDKTHYQFSNYMSKGRWCSVWYQLYEVQNLKPNNVLEVGPGPGLFRDVSRVFGLKVETLDLDPDLNPNHIGSATEMPFKSESYDVVCAFQMLEHLPYEKSLQAFSEMVRVSRRYVVISLPDSRVVWRYMLYIPKVGSFNIFIPRPQIFLHKHKFNGEHYWEINKRNYSLEKIITDFNKNILLKKTYRVPDFPYHRFFIFDKQE